MNSFVFEQQLTLQRIICETVHALTLGSDDSESRDPAAQFLMTVPNTKAFYLYGCAAHTSVQM